jgi:lysophospholipase L1-like esterase/predicted esterase
MRRQTKTPTSKRPLVWPILAACLLACGPALASGPVKIMPLGDSLTYGTGATAQGGYRQPLWNLFQAGPMSNVDFVGSQTDPAAGSFDRDHEGHPGYRIDEIDGGIVGWLSSGQPDTILLMIGTNDMIQDYDVANAPTRLSALITKTWQNSGAHIYVASIPPMTDAERQARALAYNATIAGIVSQKAAEGINASYVDVYSVVSTGDLPDGVHPNASGYSDIAQAWYGAVIPEPATIVFLGVCGLGALIPRRRRLSGRASGRRPRGPRNGEGTMFVTHRRIKLFGSLLFSVLLGAESGSQAQTLTAAADYNNVGDGIYWEKGRYADDGISATVDIPFGMAMPKDYDLSGATEYPLVLYLHGAGARGDDNQALDRATAEHFAKLARSNPASYNAFVLVPQVPGGSQWVNTSFSGGPYNQTASTHSTHMKLAESLLSYITNPANNATLTNTGILGMNGDHVDQTRIYVVGDSMGAYGTWDVVGRSPGLFAAAMAGAGSGPKNKLNELKQTPFWAMHAASDSTVPNALPSGGDPDGAGSLGILALMDPTFDNTASSALVKVDLHSDSGDDPSTTDALIYTEFPSPPFDHGIAPNWTNDMNADFEAWLFAQQIPEPATVSLLAIGTLALLRRRRRRILTRWSAVMRCHSQDNKALPQKDLRDAPGQGCRAKDAQGEIR